MQVGSKRGLTHLGYYVGASEQELVGIGSGLGVFVLSTGFIGTHSKS